MVEPEGFPSAALMAIIAYKSQEGMMDDMAAKKNAHSFYDKRGKLFVDCSQCQRGGNGSGDDKCSAGWRHKRPGKGGCFLGELLPGIEPGDLRTDK